MPRLIWTASALADVKRLHASLLDLHASLLEKNPLAARNAVKTIRQSVKLLAVHPEIGRPAEAMEPEFREWPINFGNSGYVALYRHDDKQTVILAVRHQKKAGYSSG